MAEEKELGLGEKVAKLETEFHNMNKTLGALFEKFDKFVEKREPKPLSPYMILTSIVAVLTIFALLFGSVIYISNSSTAPVVTQVNQLSTAMNTLNSNILQTNSNIQLTNKELTSVQKQTESNAQTLQWMIFEENIPKQVTKIEKDIEFLKSKVGR